MDFVKMNRLGATARATRREPIAVAWSTARRTPGATPRDLRAGVTDNKMVRTRGARGGLRRVCAGQAVTQRLVPRSIMDANMQITDQMPNCLGRGTLVDRGPLLACGAVRERASCCKLICSVRVCRMNAIDCLVIVH